MLQRRLTTHAADDLFLRIGGWRSPHEATCPRIASCFSARAQHVYNHPRLIQPSLTAGPCSRARVVASLVQLSQQPWHWRRLIATFGSMMAQVAQRWVI
jgi:hypothetical protein